MATVVIAGSRPFHEDSGSTPVSASPFIVRAVAVSEITVSTFTSRDPSGAKEASPTPSSGRVTVQFIC